MNSTTVLGELLRGRVRARGGDTRPWDVALDVQMRVRDWEALWSTPRHVVDVDPFDPGRSPDLPNTRLLLHRPDRTAAEEWQVHSGSVSFFERAPGLAGRLSRLLAWAAYRVALWRLASLRGLLKVPGRISRLLHGCLEGWRSRWRDHAELRWPYRLLHAARSLGGLLAFPAALWQATRKRRFHYEIVFRREDQELCLVGDKHITALPGWRDVSRALRHRWGGQPFPTLRTPWAQLTQLDVRLEHRGAVTPGGALALGLPAPMHGRLAMDIPEMVRRYAPQVAPEASLLSGLAGLAGYLLLVLRDLVPAHLLELLPAPAYPEGLPPERRLPSLPAQRDEFLEPFPVLQEADGALVEPELHPLRVRLHASPSDGDEEIWLALVRYRPRRLQARLAACGEVHHRSIVLMNGFAQNTLPFVAEELGPAALAPMLLREGWDVWLFEYRVSPMLEASKKFSTMDDIAARDIPAAVRHVLSTLRQDPQAPEEARAHAQAPQQIALFSHCVGSASLAMSLLGGHLRGPSSGSVAGPSLLHGVLFSQFLPRVVGSESAQMRLGVASMLHNFLGLDHIEFTAGAVQPDLLHSVADRLFRLMPVEPGEECPHGPDHPPHAHTTCRRMTSFLSPLYRHDQLHPATHARLDRYFGRTNLGVFIHGSKCVSGERIVNARGQGVYLTEQQVSEWLDMPVMLIQGDRNRLFDIESLDKSARDLRAIFGAARQAQGFDRFDRLEGFAHFDCTIGHRAPKEVFPRVCVFFDKAWRRDAVLATSTPNRILARVPRTGPLVGWAPLDPSTGARRVHLWAELDTTCRHRPVGLLVAARLTPRGGGAMRESYTWWPAVERSLPDVAVAATGSTAGAPQFPEDRTLVLGLAHVEVPADHDLDATVVGLHVYSSDALPARGTPAVRVAARARVPGPGRELDVATPQEDDLEVWLDLPADPVPSGGPEPFLQQGDAPTHALQLGPSAAAPVEPKLARALLEACALRVAQHNARVRDPAVLTLSRDDRTLLRRPQDGAVHLRWPSPALAGAPVRLALTSCRYPGLTYFEGERSDATLLALGRRQRELLDAGGGHAAVWMLGDQVYVDATAGLLDASSPIERHLPVYRQAFGSPGFRWLARHVPLYMVSDDHEIGDEWTADHRALGAREEVNYKMARATEWAYQTSHGPPGLAAGPGGSADAAFDIEGLPFYRLGTRWQRSRLQRRLLDAAQWQGLEAWLCSQVGRPGFKFIATGSVIAPGIRGGSRDPQRPSRDADNWQLSPADRARLLGLVDTLGVTGLVFLSGDYHCAAVARIELPSGGRAWSLVAPPLYAPLRFANLPPGLLLPDETIPLAGGVARAVTLAAQAAGQPPEGWMECEVTTTALTVRMMGPGEAGQALTLSLQAGDAPVETLTPH